MNDEKVAELTAQVCDDVKRFMRARLRRVSRDCDLAVLMQSANALEHGMHVFRVAVRDASRGQR